MSCDDISVRIRHCDPDLPLILILSISVYTDFLTSKLGKVQIFPPKIGQNPDFLWNVKD